MPTEPRTANEPLSIDQVNEILRQAQPGGQRPAATPRTLSTEEVNRILRDRASGLGTVGSAIDMLPESLRNPVRATATTMVRAPFGIFDLPNLLARGIDWGVQQAGGSPDYAIAPHIAPVGSMAASDVLDRLNIPETRADTPVGRVSQGLLGGTVGGATGGGVTAAVTRGPVVATALRGAELGAAGGLSSEVAGEATAGTPYETAARVVAGLAVPAAAAGQQAQLGGAARTMGRAVQGATPQQWARAGEILAEARARNQPVTVAEAMAEAEMPGAGRALVMQRTAEQGERSGQTFGQFRADQPERATQAINQLADTVAPPVYDPLAVGRRVQRAAEGAIDQATGQRTQAAQRAGYAAADPTPLTPADVAPVIARIRAERDRAGGVARTGSAYALLVELEQQIAQEATMPGFSIRRLDNIFKQTQDRLEDTHNATTQISRGDRVVLTPIVQSIRDDVLHLNPNYQAGAQTFARLTPATENVTQGLPARIASTDDPTAQIATILGPNARPGTVVDTLGRMQTAPLPRGGAPDPNVVADLVRLRLENARDASGQMAGSLPREQLGARFNVLLRTDPRAAANFEAAISRLPGGQQTIANMNMLLDIFQAQARRLQPGSDTARNILQQQDLTGTPWSLALSPTRIPGIIQRGLDRWSLGRNLEDVADVNVSPRGLLDVRAAAERPNSLLRGLLGASFDRAVEEERRARQQP